MRPPTRFGFILVLGIPIGTDVFVERRTTFYGATETFLRDAAGNVLVLAQFEAQ